MKPHHRAWLDAHPHRTAEWLAFRIAEGFDVHHLDGEHDNNNPENLVLIEHTDHMMVHGGRTLGRLSAPSGKRGPSRRYLKAKARIEAFRATLPY